MTKNKREKGSGLSGFTIIEIIVTIALVAAASLLAAPYLSDTVSRNELESASRSAADTLQEARSSAMNGRGTGRFGVRFESDRIVLFEGETYPVDDSDVLPQQLSDFVSVTSVEVGGGGSDIMFRSSSGTPVDAGTIVFADPAGNTRTVTVNSAGTVDVR